MTFLRTGQVFAPTAKVGALSEGTSGASRRVQSGIFCCLGHPYYHFYFRKRSGWLVAQVNVQMYVANERPRAYFFAGKTWRSLHYRHMNKASATRWCRMSGRVLRQREGCIADSSDVCVFDGTCDGGYSA